MRSQFDQDDEGSGSAGRSGWTPKKIVTGVGCVIAGLFLLSLVFGSFYTVDQGERGVILCNGAVCGEAEAGLHFKIPIIQSVKLLSVREEKETFKTEAYSKDQQPASVQVSVNYRLPESEVTGMYADLGMSYVSKLIDTQLPRRLKETFGQFSAQAIVDDRIKLGIEVEKSLEKALDGRRLQIISVQIEDVAFSDVYEHAVENRMRTEVEKAQAEAEKAKRITGADAAAYEVNAAADAKAHQVEVVGDAQAKAIRARGDALRDNPSLVSLTAVEKWNGILPTTMPPGGTVPFLNLPH